MPQLLAPLIIRHIISLHIKEVSVVLTKPVSRGQGRVLSHAYMYTVVSHISRHSSYTVPLNSIILILTVH